MKIKKDDKPIEHEVVRSANVYFITYMIIQILALLILFIFAIFNKDIMNLFFTNQMVNIDILKSIIYMSSIFYTIIIIVIYIINLKLFKKGVNVE